MSEGNGRTVLITGGAAGLGRTLVDRFLAAGYAVGVLDRRDGLAPEPPAELRDRVLYQHGDVCDPAAHERVVARMLERYGRIDTLVANAAIWDFSRNLMDMPIQQLADSFDELFGVNVKGYLLAARASAEAIGAVGGSMIFTLSNAALYPGGGGVLYTGSKHAGVGIVRQLAYELAPRVRVNAVAPAGMATTLSGPSGLGLSDTRMGENWDGEAFATRVPLAFVPTPEDYAAAYEFLADPAAARAITGIVLPVELGMGVRGLRNVSGGVPL